MGQVENSPDHVDDNMPYLLVIYHLGEKKVLCIRDPTRRISLRVFVNRVWITKPLGGPIGLTVYPFNVLSDAALEERPYFSKRVRTTQLQRVDEPRPVATLIVSEMATLEDDQSKPVGSELRGWGRVVVHVREEALLNDLRNHALYDCA